jgi:hypothetical protein
MLLARSVAEIGAAGTAGWIAVVTRAVAPAAAVIAVAAMTGREKNERERGEWGWRDKGASGVDTRMTPTLTDESY